MPLLLHGSFLNWLTLFGFPFTVSHGSGLVVPAKVPMFKMLMTIQILSVAFMIMFYRLGKDGLLNINYIKESIGLSGMDMVLINGALLITFVDAIALVKLLRKNMEQLNNLSMMISDDKGESLVLLGKPSHSYSLQWRRLPSVDLLHSCPSSSSAMLWPPS